MQVSCYNPPAHIIPPHSLVEPPVTLNVLVVAVHTVSVGCVTLLLVLIVPLVGVRLVVVLRRWERVRKKRR